MSRKRPRVIGTTEEAISKAEKEIGFRFPPSFHSWLLENNGLHLEGVDSIYPVYDERDPRMTWDSIVRNYKEAGWAQWIDNFEGYGEPFNFDHLLPFAEVGNGDCYCFDYSRVETDGEAPVVLWSHEGGETEDQAANFNEFVVKAMQGENEYD
jgi:cell wall assembly regulator SMI1